MIVFTSILKRIFRNKLQGTAIIVLPIAFILIMAFNISPSKNILKVSLIDRDNTDFTSVLKDKLKSQSDIVDLGEDEIEDAILEDRISYAVVIDRGFTKGLIYGDDVNIKGYYLKDSINSIPIRQFVESFITSAKAIAVSFNGDEKGFYDGLKYLDDEGAGMDFQQIANIDKGRSYSTMGIFIMFMLFSTILYTTIILIDKENMTFFRTMAAPITLKSYMLQCILSFMAISLIQVTVVLLFLKYVIGLYIGQSFLSMYLLLAASSLVFISLGVAISTIAKNVLQAGFVGIFLTLPMSFLGGCWWNNKFTTDLINTLGKFTPVYWIMNGVSGLLDNNGIGNIIWELSFILLFTLIFFLMGTWRREEITA